MGSLGLPELLIILVITTGYLLLVMWPVGLICRRLGFSPWLGLLAVVPVANLCLLWFVALAAWPVTEHSRRPA
jgi:hypothetical protein